MIDKGLEQQLQLRKQGQIVLHDVGVKRVLHEEVLMIILGRIECL